MSSRMSKFATIYLIFNFANKLWPHFPKRSSVSLRSSPERDSLLNGSLQSSLSCLFLASFSFLLLFWKSSAKKRGKKSTTSWVVEEMTTRVQVRDFVILFKRNNNSLLFVAVTVAVAVLVLVCRSALVEAARASEITTILACFRRSFKRTIPEFCLDLPETADPPLVADG